jgi:hypothetical protein
VRIHRLSPVLSPRPEVRVTVWPPIRPGATMLSVIADVLPPAVLLGPSATRTSTEQVHAVTTFTTAAEAVIQTRRPVEVKPEERRYRLVVGGKLMQVFSCPSRRAPGSAVIT